MHQCDRKTWAQLLINRFFTDAKSTVYRILFRRTHRYKREYRFDLNWKVLSGGLLTARSASEIVKHYINASK